MSHECEANKSHAETEFTRKVSKGQLEFYYLKVCMEFEDSSPDISSAGFKYAVVTAMKSLFGDTGASIPIDVLRYRQETCEALLKVPSSGFVKLWSALTLFGQYSGHRCAFRVTQVSPHLISMAANSRQYFAQV